VSSASRRRSFSNAVAVRWRARAVGLDDQAVLRPEEVDLVSTDGRVDLRPRQSRLGDQGEEPLLEL
jgi:hypothetical protein